MLPNTLCHIVTCPKLWPIGLPVYWSAKKEKSIWHSYFETCRVELSFSAQNPWLLKLKVEIYQKSWQQPFIDTCYCIGIRLVLKFFHSAQFDIEELIDLRKMKTDNLKWLANAMCLCLPHKLPVWPTQAVPKSSAIDFAVKIFYWLLE